MPSFLKCIRPYILNRRFIVESKVHNKNTILRRIYHLQANFTILIVSSSTGFDETSEPC